jgi:hypothetical protein
MHAGDTDHHVFLSIRARSRTALAGARRPRALDRPEMPSVPARLSAKGKIKQHLTALRKHLHDHEIVSGLALLIC